MSKIEIDITPASAKEALDMIPCPSDNQTWFELLTSFKLAEGREEDARAWSKTDPVDGNYQESVFNSHWKKAGKKLKNVTPAMLYCKAYHCKGEIDGNKFVYYKRGADQPGKAAAIGWNDTVPASTAPKTASDANQPEPGEEAPKAASVAEPPRAAQEDREKAEKVEEQRREQIDTAWYTEKENGLARKYLKGRGLSDATIDRFEPGLTEEKDGVVIVYPGENYYSIRKFNPQRKEDRYRKAHGEGGGRLFNFPSLTRGARVVFVVEGEFDAMSIEQAGGAAVAGPAGSCSSFLSAALDRAGASLTAQSFVIVPDNDKPGMENAEKVLKMLKDRKLDAYIRPLPDDIHDANDFIQADPVKMGKWVAREATLCLCDLSGAGRMDSFLREVEDSKKRKPISTGFPGLDNALDGGLRPGLCILGAVSSLGKTTLALQIIDNIARQGIPCLIFSLEMSAHELMAKSISRLTSELARSLSPEERLKAAGVAVPEDYITGDDGARARIELERTTYGILSGDRYAKYSAHQLAFIEKAEEEYAKFSGNIYIIEGDGQVGAQRVRKAAAKFSGVYGMPPVILVDYLQIMAPGDPHDTDKRNMDNTVSELRRIARDYHTAVIAISSLSRENYDVPISMGAFKESGGIEYSSDILLGMQLAILDDPDEIEGKQASRMKDREKIQEAKSAIPREIQVVVLKSRNTGFGNKESLLFDPRYNIFYSRGWNDPVRGGKPRAEAPEAEAQEGGAEAQEVEEDKPKKRKRK